MPKSTNLLQKLSHQALLGESTFSDTIETTLANKNAETQFRIFLITVQKFDKSYLDSLLVIRLVCLTIVRVYEDDYEELISIWVGLWDFFVRKQI